VDEAAGQRRDEPVPPRDSNGRRERRAKLLGAGAAVGLLVLGAVVTPVGQKLVDFMWPDTQGDTSPTAYSSSSSQDARLTVKVLNPGEFVPESLAHAGIYLYSDRGVQAEDVPGTALQDWSAYTRWALAHGARPAQDHVIRLSLRGTSSVPVNVIGIRVEILGREPATGGGWFVDPQAGCGVDPVRSVYLRLDKTPVEMTWDDGQGGEPRKSMSLRVTREDVEQVEVVAHTVRQDVRYKLYLLYEAEGQAGELSVGSGSEFTVLALTSRSRFFGLDNERSEPRLIRNQARDPGDNGLTFC